MLITLHEKEIKEIIADHVYQKIAMKRQSGTEAIFTEQVKLNFDYQSELVFAEIDIEG